MITQDCPITLNLEQAAKLLNLHKESLRQKVAMGKIPGAKVGRSWVFIEQDLVKYIRSLYSTGASQDAIKRKDQTWRYTKEERYGGSVSPTVNKEYSKALGLVIG